MKPCESPSSSDNPVTLDGSERERLALFFRQHAQRVAEHNRLVAIADKHKSRAKERDENIDRMKAAADRAFDDAIEQQPEVRLFKGRRRLR